MGQIVLLLRCDQRVNGFDNPARHFSRNAPTEATTMDTPTLWPDTQDQAICASFLHDFPLEGYGLCYLFGTLRGAGWSREEARALALKRMPLAQEGEGGTLPC